MISRHYSSKILIRNSPFSCCYSFVFFISKRFYSTPPVLFEEEHAEDKVYKTPTAPIQTQLEKDGLFSPEQQNRMLTQLGNNNNAATGMIPSRGWVSESDSVSVFERNAALNTGISVSDGKDWRFISSKFLDQRTRRCILCQENVPDTGFMSHCHSPLHQAREGLALEMLRRNRGTPAEVVARWWHLLEDGFPVKFFKIPKLSVPLPGVVNDINNNNFNTTSSSGSATSSSATATSANPSDEYEMDPFNVFSSAEKFDKFLKSSSDYLMRNNEKLNKNPSVASSKKPFLLAPFPRRKRTAALENGVTDVDINDLDALLALRKERCHYILKFLRDAGVLRDCFGGTFDDKNRKVMGRSFHFERLEWVGDNAGKFTIHDRVSSLFPACEGGSRGRLGMMSCLLDSNEGLSKGYDNLDIESLLPQYDVVHHQHANAPMLDSTHPGMRTVTHTNTNETRSKMKADIMEAMRGELWSFIRSGVVNIFTDNAACAPFLRGSALGLPGFDAPGANGLRMLRKLAEHAMNEIDSLALLSHLTQIGRTVTQLVKNDLKLTFERNLIEPFMPVVFDADNFRVHPIAAEQWRKNFFVSCLETDYSRDEVNNVLRELNLSSATTSGEILAASAAASKRSKRNKKKKKQQQSGNSENMSFSYSLSQEKGSRAIIESQNAEDNESDRGKPQQLPTIALSPRLFTMPRGGFTSYRRWKPKNLSCDEKLVEELKEKFNFNHEEFEIIRKQDKDSLPWISNGDVMRGNEVAEGIFGKFANEQQDLIDGDDWKLVWLNQNVKIY